MDVAFIVLGIGSLLHGLVYNPLGEILDHVLDLLQDIHHLIVVGIPFVLR